ncbi:hypothetical protein AMIS_21060 [Actinoplanes missouriensis 431]|uniref:Uncharacterized protein n=1 Tax=Actinoplanes missouriensis (strain ATCC 14538 / DSM 43046 / CBS 188.64 / JCM 3121 / NBRC 102363 / NCIMB 12654 / NRRL B-3342 / UNCC 431) TaxID=512565 RepID=I0H2T9_ACTM4|nr:hypothetical protein [Actinoplanes missouriensis]BAL87326.1 hypothetical protein AMIS_21060 [Actinoplanes missouriensis 431]
MSVLNVHNAEIHTATVELSTLTIDGRQVTQAVFKQLPSRDLISDSGHLNGTPWGWVNYHPDKCGTDQQHLHVVWQAGKVLYRALVDLDPTFPRWIDTDAASAWLDAKVREGAAGTLTGWEPMKAEFLRTVAGIPVRVAMSHEAQMVTLVRQRLEEVRRDIDVHGRAHLVQAPADRRDSRTGLTGRAAAMAAARAAARRIPAGEAVPLLEDALEKALTTLPTTPLAEAEAQLQVEVEAEAARRKRHGDVRADLAELPQLFIATG